MTDGLPSVHSRKMLRGTSEEPGSSLEWHRGEGVLGTGTVVNVLPWQAVTVMMQQGCKSLGHVDLLCTLSAGSCGVLTGNPETLHKPREENEVFTEGRT